MTNFKLGRWLLVVLAIVGLAFAAPVVSAHGTDTAADDASPSDGDWAVWMETQMTEHMGPGSVEWMESNMGVTVGEMARDIADDHADGHHGDHADGHHGDHADGHHGDHADDHHGDHYGDGMSGQGHY